MSDTYQAISKVDEASGEPYVGTCTLVMGDGTQKVEFRKGRATVPAALAHLVNRHPNIEVIGYDGGNTPPPDPGATEGGSDLQEVIAGQALRIQELEDLVKGLAAVGPALHTTPSTSGEPRVGHEAKIGVNNEHVLVGDEDVPSEVRAAMEYLQQEGEDVPQPVAKAVPARDGWEAATTDGQSRCQAAKADGGQCANQAVDGAACQLAKHKEQLDQKGE